jgi:hypothetical protein
MPICAVPSWGENTIKVLRKTINRKDTNSQLSELFIDLLYKRRERWIAFYIALPR